MCPESELACVVRVSYLGGAFTACYDKTKFVCVNDLLCAIENGNRCGDACYSHNEFTCFEDQFLCPKNYLKCSDSCYDPALYGCRSGNLFLLSNQ